MANLSALLDTLWENRNRPMRKAARDMVTGQELINIIYALNLGDEGGRVLRAAGRRRMIGIYIEKVQQCAASGRHPFAHTN